MKKWDALGVISIFGHAIEKDGVVSDFTFKAPKNTNIERVLKEIPQSFMAKLHEAAYLDQAERHNNHQEVLIARKRKASEDLVVEPSQVDNLPMPDKPI